MDVLNITLQISSPTSNPGLARNDIEQSLLKTAQTETKTKQDLANDNEVQSREKAERDAENSPDFNELVEQLEKLADNLHLIDNTRLLISYREDVSKFVYQSIDRDSGEIIKEFPSEEILDMLARFHELTGLAIDIES